MTRKEFINRSAILGASVVLDGLTNRAYGMFSVEKSRGVLQILNPHRTMVGSLPIIRAFPGGARDYISPFILLDEFGPISLDACSDPLGVAAHPHAGIVPTTYFLSGTGHHKDSLNYDIQVNKGEFMMFSSGKGAIHMEETGTQLYNEGGTYHGFQIWLNLPAKHKFIDPNTFIHKKEGLPEITTKDYSIKVVMGQYDDKKSAAYTHSPAFYYHVKMNPNSKLSFETDPTHNAFIYNVEGELELKDQTILKKNHLALFERMKSEIHVFSEGKSEFLLLGGSPLNDPIVSYGPFVMNTEQQINQCVRNYQSGKMGNPDLVK
ncbi:MAG: pirin family protein [Cyclobacteriaceae bacterium]